MTTLTTSYRADEVTSSNGATASGASRGDALNKSSQFRATLLADRNRHRRRRLVTVLALVVVVAAVGGGLVVARSAGASPTAHYRTATASVHDVEQQLTNVATIEPVTQAAVAFPTSGTVASVDVTAGATVTAGQKLATLDATSLEVTLHEKQSALANAQLALLNTNNTAAAQATSTTTTQRVTTTTAASTTAGSDTGTNTQASSGTSSTPTGSAPQASGNPSSAPTGASGSSTATPQASGSSSSAASASGGNGQKVSAEDQYAAQQAVTAAQAEVTAAEQAIAQATVVSPIDGTVQAINLEVGDSVTSGSTTATILIAGSGGVEAATTVTVDHISAVKIGQPAVVRPDGTARPIDGEVVSVSAMPVNTSGTATYRVIIGLHGDATSLGNGSTATASIITSSTKATLAVPTSAITTDGDRHTVTVLDGTATKQVEVQIGAIGETWTAVTSGLTDGQIVVLADINTPMPNASTNSTIQTNRNAAGGAPTGVPGGGFPGGGGFPAGGGPGGGAPR